MLQPFLFIGVGGSGGKTLRTLRADLQSRLLEAGDDGPWPTCWQLLHIDVPTDADGLEPDLPGQLDEKDYRGLVGHGIKYQIVDHALVGSGATTEAELRNLLGWRPDPQQVHVPIEKGAGQARALGRAVVMANLATVAEALDTAMQQLHGSQVSADLDRVSRAFDIPVTAVPPNPVAIVVSSLAGGSGSGAFMDVCDMLRAVGGPGYADNSYAVLYAPDVFNHLAPEHRHGVQANALAALSELMAGFWDMSPAVDDFALFQTRGKRNIGSPTRRGPRFPFVVGTKNDRVGFTNQNDVYRAMGKALAAWTVSDHLQSDIGAYGSGNWGQSAAMADNGGLRNSSQEQPLSAIGFGRVSLGRDNFGQYAAERLARRSVERILRQHLAGRPAAADPNHEVAIDEAVEAAFEPFVQASGLDVRGHNGGELLAGLRPTERGGRLGAATNAVHAAVIGGGTRPLPGQQWQADAIVQLRNARGTFAAGEAEQRNARARQWIGDIQQRLESLVAHSVAAHGAPVTEKLLERLGHRLDTTLDDLKTGQTQFADWANGMDHAVAEVIVASKDALSPDHPLIRQGVERGIDCYDHFAEAELRRLAGLLVDDLAKNLIEPLRSAVRGGKEVLQAREDGTPSNPSEVTRWPTGDLVPKRFQPAGNEFFLEEVDEYPKLYADLLTKSARADQPGGAETEYVQHTIVGSRPSDRDLQVLIDRHTAWEPAISELQASFGSASRARIELRVHPSHLLDRARRLVNDSDTVIGTALAESLQDHLGDPTGDPAEHERRRNRFQTAFSQALAISEPLVNIDAQALSRVHGETAPGVAYMFTEIPFPEGTPGYEVVRSVLESRGQWTDKAQKAFGEGRQSRIDVFSMLATPYSPLVFESLMGPIVHQWSASSGGGFWRWRRARPLPSFVPVSPEVRLALVRGWFTAQLLDQLQFDPSNMSRVRIWDPERQVHVPFPDPLLGPDVHQRWERLPAVLESLPIAMAKYAVQGANGDLELAPYWRLRELGTGARGADYDYKSAAPALHAWIQHGELPPGTPMSVQAGRAGGSPQDADARQQDLLGTVRGWQANYGGKVSEVVTARGLLGTDRVVEIGADITAALDELAHAISTVEASSFEGEW